MRNGVLGIQLLRAVAVILVLYLHQTALMATRFGVTDYEFSSGRIGVDIFFVISGFIISLSVSAKSVSPYSFLLQRLFRIFPLYWVYFFALLSLALIRPDLVNSFYEADLLSSFFLLPSEREPFLNVAWTLVYEVFFYVVFGVLMFFFGKERVFFCIFSFFLTCVIVLNVLYVPVLSKTYGSTLVFEFLMGVLIFKLYAANRLINPVLSFVVVVFVLLSVLFVWPLDFFVSLFTPYESVFNGREFFRFIYLGVPSFLLVYAFLSFERVIQRFQSVLKVFIVIGDASYSVYLCHYFVLVFLMMLFSRAGLVFHDFWGQLLVFSFTMVLSVLAFYVIERRLSRLSGAMLRFLLLRKSAA